MIGEPLGHSGPSTTARSAHIAEDQAKQVNDQADVLVGGVTVASENRKERGSHPAMPLPVAVAGKAQFAREYVREADRGRRALDRHHPEGAKT